MLTQAKNKEMTFIYMATILKAVSEMNTIFCNKRIPY